MPVYSVLTGDQVERYKTYTQNTILAVISVVKECTLEAIRVPHDYNYSINNFITVSINGGSLQHFRFPENGSGKPSTLRGAIGKKVNAGDVIQIGLQLETHYSNSINLGANDNVTLNSSTYFRTTNLDSTKIPMQLEYSPPNTAPTTPGAFTQPTGTLVMGDPKVFSVGASSDAEWNLAKYIWEAAINGGSFAKVGETSTPNFTYTIPTANTLKMRVKAADTGGLESGYRESTLFSISHPSYYYSRYNVDKSINWGAGNEEVQIFDHYKFGQYITYKNGVYTTTGLDYFDQNTQIGKTLYTAGIQTAADMIGGTSGTFATKYIAHTKALYNEYYKQWYVTIRKYPATGTTDVRGSMTHSGIIAVDGAYPSNGVHSDGYWYVKGSKVSQTISPPGPFSSPPINSVLEAGQVINLDFAISSAPSIEQYDISYQYDDETGWRSIGAPVVTKPPRQFTITTDKQFKSIRFRVRAKNTSSVYSDFIYSEAFQIQHNKIPTLTLETENNKTLYEKDTFTIKGSAVEPDVGDVLIVYYRLNGGTARGIETKLSDGSAIPFNEQLLFKSGQLYKGETEITGKLTEGTAHTLEVWAEDNQGGKSEIERRTFYVVPNRPPTLSIDPIEDQADLINADKLTIKGNVSDPDDNNVTVRFRINNGSFRQIYDGPSGKWNFDLMLLDMQDGENTIVIEAIDTYDFKFSKTIKLNKTANQTPLASSVQRYTIVPPAGSAQGVLLWIKRDEVQDVTVEISMTNGTELEDFKPMEFDSSGPDEIGTVEDFYKFRSDVSAEKIAIKLSWTGDKPIHQIQGALTQ